MNNLNENGMYKDTSILKLIRIVFSIMISNFIVLFMFLYFKLYLFGIIALFIFIGLFIFIKFLNKVGVSVLESGRYVYIFNSSDEMVFKLENIIKINIIKNKWTTFLKLLKVDIVILRIGHIEQFVIQDIVNLKYDKQTN